MDTTCYCCQWLLWTTAMLMLHYQEVSVSAHVCPQGQLLHLQRRRQIATCCYPTRCGVGEEVKPCINNGTQDTCQKCERHQNQSLRTSSFTMERCVDWPLNSECKNVHSPDKPRNIQDEQTKRCMCNIEQGKRFYPPESQSFGAPMDSYCQRRNDTCLPGSEPRVDGGCQPCQKNYFKSVSGHSLCEPKTNCTLLGLEYTFYSNETADNNCSQSEPMVTKPSVIQGPDVITTTSKTAEVSRQSNTTVSSTSWHDQGVHVNTSLRPAGRQTEDKILWPIVGSLIVLAAILVCAGLLMFCCRRRRLLVCVYAAAKDCTDAEDNNVQGATYEPMDCRVKHPMANGSASRQTLIRADKNNGNGTVHSGIENLPNGHVHPHGHLSEVELGHNENVQLNNPLQHIAQRPGAQRPGSRHVMFDDRRTNWPDLTLDIMSENQIQTQRDGFEANPELGESDCLLIPDHQHGTGVHQISDSTTNSPALLHDSTSPMEVLALNGFRDTNFGHRIDKNGAFLPPLRSHGQTAPVEGATFTRSVSLIASPEGEIDEEEIVALFPRFSQLLQEDDDSEQKEPASSNKNSTLVLAPVRHQQAATQRPHEFPLHHAASVRQQVPQTTQRPTEFPLHHAASVRQQVPQTTQRPTEFPLHHAASVRQQVPQTSQPDHCIMNLKEQDLLGSIQPASSQTDTASAYTMTDPTRVMPEEAQQTQLKTIGSTRVFSNSSDSDNTNTTKAKHFTDFSRNRPPNTEGISHDLAERNRHKSGGVHGQLTHQEKFAHFQNSSDQKCVPVEGNNGQTFLEQHRTRTEDQASNIKTISSEEVDTSSKDKQGLNNRVVFLNGDNLQTGNKQSSPRTDARQGSRSQKANIAQTSSDAEEAEWNPDSQKTSITGTGSKVSLNTDDSNGTNSVYRRSQSQNAPSSSDSPHKPPPRSMSEEKPQKLDRPVAKVKPMPASDSSVNQLALDMPQDDGLSPQPAANNNTINILSSSTEESDQEQDVEMNCESPSTVDEDEEDTESGPA